MNTNEILDHIKDFYNIKTDTALAKKLNVAQGNISMWRNRNKPNFGVLIRACPEMDLRHIMPDEQNDIDVITDDQQPNGTDRQFIKSFNLLDQENKSVDVRSFGNGNSVNLITENIAGLPFYNLNTTEKIMSFDEIVQKPDFFIDVQPLNDCAYWIPIIGDEMMPLYSPSDKVVIKRFYPDANFKNILWGKAYMIISDYEGNYWKIIRLLYPSNDPDKIILRAANDRYKGDTEIPKSSIKSLYIIKGKISQDLF